MRHYHVLNHRPGYLADNNHACRTLRDAQADLRYWRDTYDGEGSLVGSVRSGEFRDPTGYAYTITTCDQADCLCKECGAGLSDSLHCDQCGHHNSYTVEVPA